MRKRKMGKQKKKESTKKTTKKTKKTKFQICLIFNILKKKKKCFKPTQTYQKERRLMKVKQNSKFNLSENPWKED